MNAVEFRDVTFRYFEKGKRNILDHVSLCIPEGRITVLMGSSGCGKSTLAAVAAGLYPENGGFFLSGEVRLFGETLLRKEEGKQIDVCMTMQERAAYLSIMFQNPDLQFCMDTLRRELYFTMENICVPPEHMEEKAKEAAGILGISDLLDRPFDLLSGGEKQKASLACLWVLNSKCIVLDEAFANIDRAAAKEIIKLLLFMKEQGATILAIDHQPDLWMEIADEFIVLGAGGKTLVGNIRKENLKDYRELFLREGLFFPEGEKPGEITGTDETEKEIDDTALSFSQVTIPREVIKKRFGRKTFGESLLEDVSAEFPKGKMTAVLGESGSGKTTTFLSLLKKHPFQGEMKIFGKNIAALKPKELYRLIGIVFQNPGNQFLTQNVTDEICAGLRVWEPTLSDGECEERVQKLLEAYGLEKYRKYSPYMLSQGQQRRLAVLSVLCGGQKILLLDEPTYGQDKKSVEAIMTMMKVRMETEDLTVIFITHDEALAERWADRIYLLEGKKLRLRKDRTGGTHEA